MRCGCCRARMARERLDRRARYPPYSISYQRSTPPSPPHRSPSRSLCDPAYRGRSNPYGRDRGSVRANGSETAIDGPKCKVVDVPCVNRLENLQIAQTEGTTAGRRKYSSRMRRKVSAICDSRNESTSPTSPERSPRGDPPLA